MLEYKVQSKGVFVTAEGRNYNVECQQLLHECFTEGQMTSGFC